jgi:hypothetical protein
MNAGIFTWIFIFFSAIMLKTGFAQELYISPSDPGINELLDELASNHVIELNSVIKPYSQKLIASSLEEALKKDSLLNKRQKAEILFYLKNYAAFNAPLQGHNEQMDKRWLCADPLNIQYHSNSFSFSLRPLIGYQEYISKTSPVYSAKAGVGFSAEFWNHLAVAGGVHKTFTNQILVNNIYFVPGEGGRWNYYSKGGGDYSEWYGQITWAWKWGMIGVFRDRMMDWGNNYHGANIFTDKPPSVPYIRLKVNPAKWIEFTYFTGWLTSGVIDSARTFTESNASSTVYIKKQIAANLLTVRPWKYLDVSFGNSIIYDGGIQFAYLIPVMFFKSVDHTLTPGVDNQNSQMFFDVSSRNIKHLHLYLTLFVDEFKLSRIFHADENNFLGWKGGLQLSDFPVPNLFVTIEGTRTLPITYQHYVPSLTFTSDEYNFGNYLRDNSQEIYIEAGFKPIKKLHISLAYNFAEHGDDYVYGTVADPTTLPVLKNITWNSQSITANISYDVLSNLNAFLSFQFVQTSGPEEVKYSPPIFQGSNNILSFGFQLGY